MLRASRTSNSFARAQAQRRLVLLAHDCSQIGWPRLVRPLAVERWAHPDVAQRLAASSFAALTVERSLLTSASSEVDGVRHVVDVGACGKCLQTVYLVSHVGASPLERSRLGAFATSDPLFTQDMWWHLGLHRLRQKSWGRQDERAAWQRDVARAASETGSRARTIARVAC